MRVCAPPMMPRPQLLRSKPPPDPLHRLLHVRGRSGIAEADEMAAAHRIEVGARRRRDVRLVEHALGKIEAVGAKTRNISIKIEGTIDGKNPVEPGLGQAFEQNPPVLLLAVLHRLHLGTAVEGGLRGHRRNPERWRLTAGAVGLAGVPVAGPGAETERAAAYSRMRNRAGLGYSWARPSCLI